jgi:hypothetical protein
MSDEIPVAIKGEKSVIDLADFIAATYGQR